MIVLALDTTTRGGSLALERDGVLIEEFQGDMSRPHAERLPGDLVALLARHGLEVGAMDLFGVAVGPGSFTGLRIGIASVQGLAFAARRPVVGVSALDALGMLGHGEDMLVGAWMDAHRGEVFSALYERRAAGSSDSDRLPALVTLDEAAVGSADACLARWAVQLEGRSIAFVGDGATTYHEAIVRALGSTAIVRPGTPALAAVIARLAAREAEAGRAAGPEAVRPLYVRRPDVELARDRRAHLQR